MGGRYNIHKDWTRVAYLSVVMDLYNREIIGYSLSKSVDTELIKRALQMHCKTLCFIAIVANRIIK